MPIDFAILEAFQTRTRGTVGVILGQAGSCDVSWNRKKECSIRHGRRGAIDHLESSSTMYTKCIDAKDSFLGVRINAHVGFQAIFLALRVYLPVPRPDNAYRVLRGIAFDPSCRPLREGPTALLALVARLVVHLRRFKPAHSPPAGVRPSFPGLPLPSPRWRSPAQRRCCSGSSTAFPARWSPRPKQGAKRYHALSLRTLR